MRHINVPPIVYDSGASHFRAAWECGRASTENCSCCRTIADCAAASHKPMLQEAGMSQQGLASYGGRHKRCPRSHVHSQPGQAHKSRRTPKDLILSLQQAVVRAGGTT